VSYSTPFGQIKSRKTSHWRRYNWYHGLK